MSYQQTLESDYEIDRIAVANATPEDLLKAATIAQKISNSISKERVSISIGYVALLMLLIERRNDIYNGLNKINKGKTI